MFAGSWSVREWLAHFCQPCWLKHHFFIVLLVRGLCAEIIFVWTIKSAELGCRWQCVSHHQCRDHIWTFVKWFGWIVVVLACFISDWSLTSQNCLLSSAETISHQIQTLPNVFCNVEFTMNKILLWLMTLHEKNAAQEKCEIQLFQFFSLALVCMIWCGLAAILYDYHSHAPQFAWTGKSMELKRGSKSSPRACASFRRGSIIRYSTSASNQWYLIKYILHVYWSLPGGLIQ